MSLNQWTKICLKQTPVFFKHYCLLSQKTSASLHTIVNSRICQAKTKNFKNRKPLKKDGRLIYTAQKGVSYEKNKNYCSGVCGSDDGGCACSGKLRQR
jgi:hypothetical protein